MYEVGAARAITEGQIKNDVEIGDAASRRRRRPRRAARLVLFY